MLLIMVKISYNSIYRRLAINTKQIQSFFTLPLFMKEGSKWWMIIITALFTAGLYMITNHIHLFPPHILQFDIIDRSIPFIPITLWVYMSETSLFITACYFAKDIKVINKLFYAFIMLQIVSNIVFIFWPTTFPRELFPLTGENISIDPITNALFIFLRTVDEAANCLPSLHVSSVYLISFIYLEEQKKKFIPFFIWATLVAISTITTKQHYFIDVLAGFILAVVHYVIFFKLVKYRKVFLFSRNS